MKRKEFLNGKSASEWRAIGVAHVAGLDHTLADFRGGILVLRTISLQDIENLPNIGRLHGLITEYSADPEVAECLRKHRIPYLAECKDATSVVEHGETVELRTEKNDHFVQIYPRPEMIVKNNAAEIPPIHRKRILLLVIVVVFLFSSPFIQGRFESLFMLLVFFAVLAIAFFVDSARRR